MKPANIGVWMMVRLTDGYKMENFVGNGLVHRWVVDGLKWGLSLNSYITLDAMN